LNDMPDDGITRRHFVAGSAAFGAAVVWISPYPFGDAAIGQTIAGHIGFTAPEGKSISRSNGLSSLVRLPVWR